MKTLTHVSMLTILLYVFLIATVMVSGCQTTKKEVVTPQVKQGYQSKYAPGDCVRFDPDRISMKSDGTPMLVIGIRKDLYAMVISHKDVGHGEPLFFNAVIKVFDKHTMPAECPKNLRM